MNGGKVAGVVLAAGGVAAIVWAWKSGLLGGTGSGGPGLTGLTANISYQAVPTAS